ncbi:MAG: serine/threonine-protein phosphatase [Merismopedia sp. SIO2A8]|nr:serine/threonine-protein phosphatase [Merismopedia sp. SIO2A8]
MNRLFTGMTDPGCVRSTNQDAYYTDEAARFFIVADGMGGHAGGQEASRIATEVVRDYLDEAWSSPRASSALLKEAVLKANLAILQDQRNHPERGDMGTTIVVVVFRDDQPMCAHIGDSRLYRLRGARLEQITEDHTWVARALKSGELKPDQVRVHPWRHILSKCLGREDLHNVEIQSFDLQPNDRLLLCSDGLTEELSRSHIVVRHHPAFVRTGDEGGVPGGR